MVRFSRIEKEVTAEEEIARIISWIVQLAYLIYMRHEIMKTAEYYDERSTTPSDYSIMIKFSEPQINLKSKLSTLFKELFNQPYQIQEFTFIPDQSVLGELEN